MSAEKLIEVAASQLGYLEKASNSQLDSKTANVGYNNWTKYGAWYGINPGAWCDMFVSWCAAQAGEGDAVGKFAYCPYHVQFFKNKGQWFAKGAKTPQPGDIIFFGDADHVGIVESVSGNTVYTIEGNTRETGYSTNGGGVYRKSYSLTSSYIMGYGRPNYAAQTYTAGWVKDSTGWWYRNSDGSYPKSTWKKIDSKWYYFGEDGYMVSGQWQEYKGNLYYLGADGAMVTGKDLYIDKDGKLVPKE